MVKKADNPKVELVSEYAMRLQAICVAVPLMEKPTVAEMLRGAEMVLDFFKTGQAPARENVVQPMVPKVQ